MSDAPDRDLGPGRMTDERKLTAAQQRAFDWLTKEWQATPELDDIYPHLVGLREARLAELRDVGICEWQWRRRPGVML